MLASVLAPSLAATLPASLLHGRERRGDASVRSSRRATAATIALLAAVVTVDALAGGGPRAPRDAVARDSASELSTLLGGDLRQSTITTRRATGTPAPLDAYLVTSVRDCASNLDALDLLARDAIAPGIRLAAALVVTPRHHRDGRASESDTKETDDALRTVREAIAARGLPTPAVRPLDPPTAILLRRLGYRTTPFLVVVDSAGTLRFATPPAHSFADYRGLARTLTAIAADARDAR